MGSGIGHDRCRLGPHVAALVAAKEYEMEGSSFWGSMLPLWIIGAPWLMALLELARTPKPSVRYDTHPSTTSTTATPYARPA
ncbi:MAG: hypothetical protein MZW92_48325 [Comamonadaceae bacterium]|nr:hypothetical protein [Comamonadaceae bacterium]